MKFRKKVILAKIESVYASDPTPTGAANAVLASEVEISPLEAETISRDLIRPHFGGDLEFHVGEHVKLSFSVELAGSGTAGTAPAFGALLRACGMSETITPGTRVVYAPVSDSQESCTLYFNMDGALHKLTGCRGTMTLAMESKQFAKFKFELTGLWNAPGATALPSADFSAFQKPLPIGPKNTGSFSLHGWSGIPVKLDFDLGNEVVFNQTITTEEVLLVDRAVKGNVTVEAPELGTKNFFSDALNNGTGALSLTHGTVAGNTVTLAAPNVQLLTPKYGDRDGVATIEMGMSLIPSDSGDDELTITVA